MNIQRIFIISVVLVAGCITAGRVTTPNDCKERASALQQEVSMLRTELKDRDAQFRDRLAEVLWDNEPAIWLCDQDIREVERTEWLESNDIATVLQALNQAHRDISNPPTLVLIGMEVDTVRLEVENADTLTHGMGSTGAQCYLASVTFSVTSLPGIDYVWLDFVEGDHARPGRYGRANFPHLFPLELAETE